jgi:replicative DNA helicase
MEQDDSGSGSGSGGRFRRKPRPFVSDEAAALRVPPNSLEAEQAVLGGLLLDNSTWDTIADRLHAEDFYRRDHQLIFEAILDLSQKGEPSDAVTLAERLASKGLADETGGLAYLAGLARDTPTAENIRAYADIVRERSLLRQLIRVSGEIAGSAYESEGKPAGELVDEAERRIFQIAEKGQRQGSGFVAVREVLGATIDRLDMLHASQGQLTGLSSGFTELDKMTAGLQPGDLVIVAGRPSMGKTTFALNIAENAAIAHSKPVAIFSMEMSREQLAFRMISSLGRVDQGHMRTGNFGDEDWARINSAIAQMKSAPIYIDDGGSLTPTEVRARARRLARECEKQGGLGLIVIDYIQLMQVAGNKENRATEISEISRSIKSLAKELRVPIIALSQLNRGVEQRQDKKPVMSDLRECVTGDTLVVLADGRRVPIRDLVGTTPRVLAVDEQQKVVAATSDRVWSVGVKAISRLVLASGRTLRATGRHRVLTGKGWQQLDDMTVGDRVAISRNLPVEHAGASWRDEELILLGHLVGDGSYLSHQPLRYTTASEENSLAVREAAEALGSSVSRHAGRGLWHQLVIAGNGNRWHPAGVGAWLKKLGIFGQRSHEKHLPGQVFALPDDQIALLLRHLWATDGCIHVRDGNRGRGSDRVYFATSSERLALDVAALLLRFGIVARIRAVAQRSARPVYNVDVTGAEQQRLFISNVGVFGPRLAQAEKLVLKLERIEENTNVDTLPVECFEQVRVSMRTAGVTARRMAEMRGTAYGGSAHSNFAPSRRTLDSYAELLHDSTLKRWANSDLFWDRVVAIEPVGEEEVFDLTVPGPESWLADGMVVHNSGAIEQDADLIMMIYREEVYEPDTPRKGIADIIITKQRNGPTGEVHLTFLGKYTRFENLAHGDYGGYGD